MGALSSVGAKRKTEKSRLLGFAFAPRLSEDLFGLSVGLLLHTNITLYHLMLTLEAVKEYVRVGCSNAFGQNWVQQCIQFVTTGTVDEFCWDTK